MLQRLFKLHEHQTTVKREIIAGITTFLTMAYIIFVNPAMLADAGMDKGSVFVATCLASAAGCFIMGFLANYPIALAPGMGLNAFFTYTVVLEMGYSWEAALGAVFLSGVLFIGLSIFKIREWLINTIPLSLRRGIAVGIGLFLAIIALKNAGIIIDNPATLVGLGDMNSFPPLMTALGLFLIIGLKVRNISGAVMISILAVTLLSVLAGYSQWQGVVSLPPSIEPTFFALDIASALEPAMISVVFALLFVDLFDTSGTLIAVAQRGNLLDKDGKMPRLNRALLADSGATVIGATLGTSTTTSYIESTAGVSAGGRTGLTSVMVGLLFLLALFLSPLAATVPPWATAGALLYIAILMMAEFRHIDWDDLTDTAPVVIAALMMPLTFSIANGIIFGFITYTAIKLFAGRHKEISLGIWVLTAIFIAKIIAFS